MSPATVANFRSCFSDDRVPKVYFGSEVKSSPDKSMNQAAVAATSSTESFHDTKSHWKTSDAILLIIILLLNFNPTCDSS